jgi:hypothetical protein
VHFRKRPSVHRCDHGGCVDTKVDVPWTRRGANMALTTTPIDRLKPRESLHRIRWAGVNLEIFPSGSRSWRFRYRHNRKLEKVSFGQYAAIGLKAARDKRNEYAELLATSISPAKQKQAEKFPWRTPPPLSSSSGSGTSAKLRRGTARIPVASDCIRLRNLSDSG